MGRSGVGWGQRGDAETAVRGRKRDSVGERCSSWQKRSKELGTGEEGRVGENEQDGEGKAVRLQCGISGCANLLTDPSKPNT